MNWKVIILGGLAYFVATFAMGAATGPLIHEGVLEELYNATSVFWRPELNQDPPDLAALMPRWIAGGLLTAFLYAGIYDCFRSALNGSAVIKGLKYGFVLFLITSAYAVAMSGIFNLPNAIWGWWMAEGLLYSLVGGAALGWVTQKLSPE